MSSTRSRSSLSSRTEARRRRPCDRAHGAHSSGGSGSRRGATPRRPLLVDGAHAPGSIAAGHPVTWRRLVRRESAQPSHAPRLCGILWAKPDRQAPLRHPVASWGSGGGFLAEFDRHATSYPTTYLAAPEGIAILREWGFDDGPRVHAQPRARGRASAHGALGHGDPRAADDDRRRWSRCRFPSRRIDGCGRRGPCGSRCWWTIGSNVVVQTHAPRGRLWARISAQVYNDHADIMRLADAVYRRVARG